MAGIWEKVTQFIGAKRRAENMLGNLSRYRYAKAMYRRRVSIMHQFKDVGLIVTGVFSAAFGLKGFLLPNGFIDGGVTGISLLSNHVTQYPIAVFLIFINMPFVLLGLSQIGRAFFVKSILAIIGLGLAVSFVNYPVITQDNILAAAFGGFFLGAGIGLSVRGGAVLDGTEVLAIHLSRRLGLTIGDIILIFNILIFSVAAWLLSVEVAMYSILTYLSASKTVDFFIEGVEEYTGVTIVSNHSDEIRQMILHVMGRGVTIYQGKRGYASPGVALAEMDIVFTVITRLEIAKLHNEVDKIDPHAFMVMNSIKDTKGGIIKKRPLTK